MQLKQFQIKMEASSLGREWGKTLFLAFSGSILIFFMGFEYFFRIGIFLTILYFISILIVMKGIGRSENLSHINERRANIILTFSTFLLLFLLFQGSSTQAGILFGLYLL